MAPLLSDQERIFINKLYTALRTSTAETWWCSGIRWTDSKSFIKRVIGLPGETVDIRRGLLYVNGLA